MAPVPEPSCVVHFSPGRLCWCSVGLILELQLANDLLRCQALRGRIGRLLGVFCLGIHKLTCLISLTLEDESLHLPSMGMNKEKANSPKSLTSKL